ncbi:IclR family transcriptional regulator C-terminal domain-containing protein [Streptomyces sp. NPDC007856]|uniref:IclR family transcriptional regulator domain-containing protein n=1 Tax=Streptomyces sp. NPDC007856 TaxID=3364781 RepID=UPI0036A6A974
MPLGDQCQGVGPADFVRAGERAAGRPEGTAGCRSGGSARLRRQDRSRSRSRSAVAGPGAAGHGAGRCTYSAEELERGLNAVAAPVVAFDGQLVAVLSASRPSFRLNVRRLREVVALVPTAAQDISGRLGHLGCP